MDRALSCVKRHQGLTVMRFRAANGDVLVVDDTGTQVAVLLPAIVCLSENGSLRSTESQLTCKPVVRDHQALVHTSVLVSENARIDLTDEWGIEPDGTLRVVRSTRVSGTEPAGYSTTVLLRVLDNAAKVEVVAPGASYGPSNTSRDWTFSAPTVPIRRIEDAVLRGRWIRQDRLASPSVVFRDDEGRTVSVGNPDTTARTTAADGAATPRDTPGDAVVDTGIDLPSVGGALIAGGVAVGSTYPAVEPAPSYSTTAQGLPFFGSPAPSVLAHPVRDGHEGTFATEFTLGYSIDLHQALSEERKRQWRHLRPRAETVGWEQYALDVTRVLSKNVRSTAITMGIGRPLVGIGLEANPVSGTPVADSSRAVMGFVGANTDAAWCLLRSSDLLRSLPSSSRRGLSPDVLRTQAVEILDSFAQLPMEPPAGEGFDLNSGRWCTYREISGVPAVFLRAVAEGGHALLRSYRYEKQQGRNHETWLQAALAGARWIRSQQDSVGLLPRAWEAGSGRILDPARNSTATAIRFLVDVEPDLPGALASATLAAEGAWAAMEHSLDYVGGTLDNPNVPDKEAAILASEAFLALFRSTGEQRWLDRSVRSAVVAESWTHLQDLPMPSDIPGADLHWDPADSIVGLNLITTGVTMSDGFLAANAAHFWELGEATNDAWMKDVARLVFHGPKATISTDEHPHGFAEPGWQQEHWGFGPTRGRGLNRHWLPWAAVATLGGFFRVVDLGPKAVEEMGLGAPLPPLSPTPSIP